MARWSDLYFYCAPSPSRERNACEGKRLAPDQENGRGECSLHLQIPGCRFHIGRCIRFICLFLVLTQVVCLPGPLLGLGI